MASKRPTLKMLTKTCERWNETHPLGTPVRVWTGVREGEGRETTTRSVASILGGHTAVVWVEGVDSCVALSHVESRNG